MHVLAGGLFPSSWTGNTPFKLPFAANLIVYLLIVAVCLTILGMVFQPPECQLYFMHDRQDFQGISAIIYPYIHKYFRGRETSGGITRPSFSVRVGTVPASKPPA